MHVENTLGRIGFCRTQAMGGRKYHCEPCDVTSYLYNSCGDRHCPQCSGAKRAKWLDKATNVIIPGITYFQAVFTLPQVLSSLILGNRSILYKLLFQSAWESLQQALNEEHEIEPVAAMVLHTWNQRLGHHPHVHALIPGSGPSRDGTRFVPCKMTKGSGNKPSKPFLVDNKRLGHRFRELFLAGIECFAKKGELQIDDEPELERILAAIRLQDWVVFIEPPPKPECQAEHVLKYLARYMTGGPISNARIDSEKDGMVYFWARSESKKKGERELVRRTCVEFVRSWTLHILPKGFTRSRFFGSWSNTKRTSYTAKCKALLSGVLTTRSEPIAIPVEEPTTTTGCPKCQSPMKLVETTFRPSWRDLFYGPSHPEWMRSIHHVAREAPS